MPEKTDQAIEEYLDGLHSVLWGRAYDINDKNQREAAKRFILSIIENVAVIRHRLETEEVARRILDQAKVTRIDNPPKRRGLSRYVAWTGLVDRD